jgi:pimeloyl-ACP methyl ester carboxylesterase
MFRRSPVCLTLLGAICCVPGCRTASPPDPTPAGPEPILASRRLAPIPVMGADVPPGFRAEMIEAPVFGGQAFVVEGGKQNGPLVVLIHGLGENGCRDFYPVFPALAEDYHVMAVDLPGFGRSTHGTDLYSPERYAQFIRAVVRQRYSGPFNLVGHSMGGAISLMYASRFPGDLQRLFLVDAAGFLHRKAFVNFAVSAGLDRILGVFSGAGKELFDTALQAAALAIGPVPTTPEPDFLLKSDLLRSSVLGTPTRIAALATMLENFAPAIADVRTPTWILWGKNDGVASVRTAKILERRLPLAQLQVLESSGHDPMSSAPAAVSRFLLDGLAAYSTAAPGPTLLLPSGELKPGRCEGKSGVRFAGEYSDIEIVGCQDVRLEGVRSGAIRIQDSVVTIEGTRAGSSGTALDVKNSRVEITASDFAGDVALESSAGEIDLAGVTLEGKSKSVHVARSSRLIFSVSRVDSPVGHRYVHERLELGKGDEL